jgi:uncharacterized heparinase superfamily protein
MPYLLVPRCWYVLRYHRPSQLAMRLVRLARTRLARLLPGRCSARTPSPLPEPRDDGTFLELLKARLAARPDDEAAQRARQILEGRFRFLHDERTLSDPVDWRPAGEGVSRLWRFQLHSQQFLLALARQALADRDPKWSERAWQLIEQWIAGNPLGDQRSWSDAWHPFCISLRLPVWMLLWAAFPPVGRRRQSVHESMALQADFLRRNLEWDLRGNHLLENARTLVLCGTFFQGPEAARWLHQGARIMEHELGDQLLASGEHFERSPMYHAIMLEAVVEAGEAARRVMPSLSSVCAGAALKMATFLDAILHPDEQIPLFGDSCVGDAPLPGPLIARARASVIAGRCEQDPAPVGAMPVQFAPRDSDPSDPELAAARTGVRTVGDYWVYRRGGDFLVFDAGRVGADHLPAHAHADLLGLEASVAGRRFFVDSGVFDYGDGEMRRYCRSTAAHNAVEIDGLDQCDMWSRFRMGYRGWPSRLVRGQADGFDWASATHNAYRRLGVPVVGRWVGCRAGGPWFVVDWAEGNGKHQLVSRLHLHPDVQAEQIELDRIRICREGLALNLQTLTPGTLSLKDGWYCPEFGQRQPNRVVEWAAAGPLPVTCGWVLTWPGREGKAALQGNVGPRLCLSWIDGHGEVQLRPWD